MTAYDDLNNPKTFDLIAALTGRSYPQDTVRVVFDEAGMYALAKATDLAYRNPASKELEEARVRVEKALEGDIYEFTVRGVPRHILKTLTEKVLAKYPITKFGEATQDPGAEDYFAQLEWEMYVVKVKSPDGSEVVPTPDDIAAMLKLLPASGIHAVASAIASLRDNAERGYEQLVQGLDFLSQPFQTEEPDSIDQ